jgi:hypothetical protein
MNFDLDHNALLEKPKKKPSHFKQELEVSLNESSNEMIYDLTQELNRSPVKVIPFRTKNVTKTYTMSHLHRKYSVGNINSVKQLTVSNGDY